MNKSCDGSFSLGSDLYFDVNRHFVFSSCIPEVDSGDVVSVVTVARRWNLPCATLFRAIRRTTTSDRTRQKTFETSLQRCFTPCLLSNSAIVQDFYDAA